ncbi:hypothetical protein M0R45_011385 [Rubus argutus]|uniref:Uncharacterized protein n=1 Tax=Rubus argutus TaxID=59490 RepID=A0AAW1Y9X1_RUBAR
MVIGLLTEAFEATLGFWSLVAALGCIQFVRSESADRNPPKHSHLLLVAATGKDDQQRPLLGLYLSGSRVKHRSRPTEDDLFWAYRGAASP